MSENVFSRINIEGFSFESASASVLAYREYAHSLILRYAALRRVAPALDNQAEGIELVEKLNNFEGNLTKLLNRVPAEQGKLTNISDAQSAFREFAPIVDDMDSQLERYSSQIRLNALNSEVLTNQVTELIQGHFRAYTAEIKILQDGLQRVINQGVEQLLDIKQNLSLAGNFKSQISVQAVANRRNARWWLVAFVSALLLIPVALYAVHKIGEHEKLPTDVLWPIHASVVVSMLWISKWFSRNFAEAKSLTLHFDHLERLLNEGFATIKSMVDESARPEVSRKVANLFLDLSDPLRTKASEPESPAEMLKDAIASKKAE